MSAEATTRKMRGLLKYLGIPPGWNTKFQIKMGWGTIELGRNLKDGIYEMFHTLPNHTHEDYRIVCYPRKSSTSVPPVTVELQSMMMDREYRVVVLKGSTERMDSTTDV